MNDREELKRLIKDHPEVCDRLLEIVQLLITQRLHNQTATEESE